MPEPLKLRIEVSAGDGGRLASATIDLPRESLSVASRAMTIGLIVLEEIRLAQEGTRA